ncbi:hypothetical protein BGZ65_008551 [Modicella reniformis]|uniref:Uncharacterized protein n=1 Tax=Modicella reniformis TaxID=1440133 RepID=A0A9P6IU12_9FUNG|nr:hypothetical protein BGZ65_008551 [Modicella reniformis]
MITSPAFLLVIVAILSGTALGYRDNCSGSGLCNKGMGPNCRGAYARFSDNTVYNGYTSRTNGNCVAIYRCDGSYPGLSGAQIKNLFAPIYGGQGCKGCGSHAFNGGSYEGTLNYCSNCVDSGNPN